jgi:hypothetical protein
VEFHLLLRRVFFTATLRLAKDAAGLNIHLVYFLYVEVKLRQLVV